MKNIFYDFEMIFNKNIRPISRLFNLTCYLTHFESIKINVFSCEQTVLM